ncbi:hypothetical protein KXD40_007053 [Peronospora effusa]|uniref:START domain-containing protein n=1 Tax=Peronospora effusa TaxID=542832 RepID=A0A3M6VKF4_9STRA|nr:hypothetical protein DD238_002338 [Peronospora effusa]UIZ24996.1 hypothetical protein KXD40_007053 [Peronospora effusa]
MSPMDLAGDAMDTKKQEMDQDQRAKNRLIVKRCYYKKLSTLNELRDQVTTLETEYERLLEAHHQRDAQPSTEEYTDDNGASSSALHRAYVQLAQLKSALTKENAELKRLEADHVTMEKQVAQLTAAQGKAAAAVRLAQEDKRVNPMLIVNPLSLEQCHTIAQVAYDEVLTFRESTKCFTNGTNILGWKDRHKLLPDKLMFCLEKAFHDRTLEEVSRGMWHVLSQPESLSKMYPRDVKSHFHVTQRLDENTVIYYHTLEREETEVRVRAFILAMRVDLGPDRCIVFYRSLDPKAYLHQEGDMVVRDPRGRKKVEPQKEEVWMETFIWGVYERAGELGEHCKHDVGGVIESTELATAGWWGLEILQIAMRFEAQVMGPQALLQ